MAADALETARRIAVVGSPGSGKSRLSTLIGALTGLPVVHLDRLAWRSGWREADRDELLRAHAGVLEGPEWVIDGNYTHVGKAERVRRADLVIVLEAGRMTCLRRIVRRWLTHRGRSRPDMATACVERFELGFLRFVWAWHDRHPAYGWEIERQAGSTPVVVLHSDADLARFVGRLRRARAAAARP